MEPRVEVLSNILKDERRPYSFYVVAIFFEFSQGVKPLSETGRRWRL